VKDLIEQKGRGMQTIIIDLDKKRQREHTVEWNEVVRIIKSHSSSDIWEDLRETEKLIPVLVDRKIFNKLFKKGKRDDTS
jgi:hypothetical protein